MTKTEPLQITPGKAQVQAGWIYVMDFEGEIIALAGGPTYSKKRIHPVTSPPFQNGYFYPVKREETDANLELYADAHNTYNALPVLPSELKRRLEEAEANRAALLKERDEAVTHLRRMFEGFDFESGLGKPEAADSENAWNFLSTQTPTE